MMRKNKSHKIRIRENSLFKVQHVIEPENQNQIHNLCTCTYKYFIIMTLSILIMKDTFNIQDSEIKFDSGTSKRMMFENVSMELLMLDNNMLQILTLTFNNPRERIA